MTNNQELELLFENQSFDCKKFYGQGYVPNHYKRMTCTKEEADELAKLGFLTIGKYFEESLFYTQAVIAGAVFSDKYDNIIVVTPSSYGKSWLMGRIAVIMAYEGNPTYIAHANGEGTKIMLADRP